MPSGREQLHEYEGNKMIVTLDKETLDPRSLELAYRYARCRCLMAAERELALDAAGVRDAAEEALSALKEAQRIRSSLTGASNSVTAAHEALDVMVGRVEASLERVESLISSSPDSGRVSFASGSGRQQSERFDRRYRWRFRTSTGSARQTPAS